MLLKVCLSGARSPSEHPALPVTPAQVARDTSRVRDAGAQAVHVHIKDEHGADTFAASFTDARLSAVRDAAPGLPAGVTTGAWILPEPADRVGA